MPKPSISGGIAGAGSGAAIGGSVGGPPGAVIGAIGGGLTGYLGGGAGEKKQKVKPTSTQTKEQKELSALINEGLTKGTGPFKDLFGEFNEEEFNKGVGNPAMKKFKEEILPQLQERFVAGGFSPQGSGIQREERKASVDFQSKLAELMYGAQQGQKNNRLAGIQAGMNASGPENLVQGASPGVGTSALQGLIKEAPALINGFLSQKNQTEPAPVQGAAVTQSPGPIRAPTTVPSR